jgi:hypothetical protein
MRHAYGNADGDSNSDANADANADSYSDAYGYTDGDSHVHANGDRDGDTYTDSNSYSHGNGHGYSNTDGNSHSAAETNPDTTAKSDTAAAALIPEGAVIGKTGTRETTSRVPGLKWINAQRSSWPFPEKRGDGAYALARSSRDCGRKQNRKFPLVSRAVLQEVRLRHCIAFDRWPTAKSDPIRSEPIVGRAPRRTPIKNLAFHVCV